MLSCGCSLRCFFLSVFFFLLCLVQLVVLLLCLVDPV